VRDSFRLKLRQLAPRRDCILEIHTKVAQTRQGKRTEGTCIE